MRHERPFPSPSPLPKPTAEQAAHRAALEALFTKTPTPPPASVTKRESAKMVVARPREEDGDPRAAVRTKLLARLLGAEGRAAVTRASEEYARAGFAFPLEQEVMLQLLEHTDEARVRTAMGELAQLLATDPPRRRAVLESRLRRLEELAEEPSTRGAASDLRRKVSGFAAARRTG